MPDKKDNEVPKILGPAELWDYVKNDRRRTEKANEKRVERKERRQNPSGEELSKDKQND